MFCSTGQAFQGFGINTGGDNQPIYYVTSLADSGKGSLRDALSGENRHIVFDVNGDINLQSPINVKNFSNITIDGATRKAETKALVINNYGIYFSGAKNIIVQNIRIRNAKKYGVLLSNGTNNVIIDHCSIENSSQADVEFGKNVDITTGSHDITVSYCIVAYYSSATNILDTKYKGLLVTDDNVLPAVTNIALHHNIFSQNFQRSPEISSAGNFALVNNVISQWMPYGSRMRNGAWGNMISNYYQSNNKPQLSLILESDCDKFYLQDNYGVNTANLNQNKISTTIVDKLPKITTTAAVTLREALVATAGAMPHDTMDNAITQLVASFK